jgi:hypothetical protein
MNRISIVTALTVIASQLIGSAVGVAGTAVLGKQSKSRHMFVSPGETRIPSIVRPTDELVIVEIGGPLVRTESNSKMPTLDGDLTFRTRYADVIAIAEYARSQSMLVDNETWIDTDVTLVVRQVIKDTEPTSLKADGSITFRQSGGEMQIGGARVRADQYYAFTTGARYLVFIRKTSQERTLYIGLLGSPVRITTDGRLAPMMMSTGKPMTAPSPLYDMDLKTVIGELIMRMRPQ